APPDVPPFPTRRSSDLTRSHAISWPCSAGRARPTSTGFREPVLAGLAAAVGDGKRPRAEREHDGHDRQDGDQRVALAADAGRLRSEEHTSELQSRENLV